MIARLIDTIKLRKMTKNDLNQVIAIEKKSYDFAWSDAVLKDCLFNKYDCYVAGDDNILGYMISKITNQDSHILNLTIDSDYRGLGIGSSLLDLMIKECKLHRSEYIYLEVRLSNTIARNLYQKFGFRSIGVRKNYYKNKSGREDAIVYRKNLLI
tara:strand:- start:81 stop:545 length:465 start_codon:yes stop_codon:yes gene_type:complete